MYISIGARLERTTNDPNESLRGQIDRKVPFDKIIGMSTHIDSDNFDKAKQEENNKSVMEKITREWERFSEKINWKYCIWQTVCHLGFVAALSSYLFGVHSVPSKTMTVFWIFVYGYLASMGVTAGAHRLWTHRSFKAKFPLRVLLMILYCGTGLASRLFCSFAMFGLVYTVMQLNSIPQYPLRSWIRDHRQHHKFTDTDLDPHDSSRGLFYSHWGWILLKRSPACTQAGKIINMDDIAADPVVMFQHKHWLKSTAFFCFVVPSAVPVIFWDESILHAVLTQCIIRYVYQMNLIFSVNSLAHYWGYRPYNRSMSGVDNPLISMLAAGEGTHNYHHTFPWDYKATEFPYLNFNMTALFIRVMASLGLAYDLKEASPELVKKFKERNNSENLVSKNHSD